MSEIKPLANTFESIKTMLRLIVHRESHMQRIALGMELTESLTELENVLTELIVTINDKYNMDLFKDGKWK